MEPNPLGQSAPPPKIKKPGLKSLEIHQVMAFLAIIVFLIAAIAIALRTDNSRSEYPLTKPKEEIETINKTIPIPPEENFQPKRY